MNVKDREHKKSADPFLMVIVSTTITLAVLTSSRTQEMELFFENLTADREWCRHFDAEGSAALGWGR